MKILGHGIDAVDEERMGLIFSKYGKTIMGYYFTNNESDVLNAGDFHVSKYCGKLAIKEAVLKSLGQGLGAGISFNQIDISNDSDGKSKITLLGKLKQIAEEKGDVKFLTSVTHSKDMSFASVIALI